MAILDERIRRELLDLYQELLAKGEWRVGADLQRYYDIFRDKFGPERLRDLDGEELLDTLHGPGKNSLAYWLERKNDDEFPSGFGSIAGGSAYKFGLFLKRDTGFWMSGSSQNPVVLTQRQALEKARQQRDQLLAGVEILENMPAQGSDEDYEDLQQEMDRIAPEISNSAWGHKYFSLLFPDKLDDYHAGDYQRFHLVKLLQIPPSMEGRYVCAGRFITVARELELAVNTLTHLLNVRSGDPHRYWRIGTRGWISGEDFWEHMQAGNYCATGFNKVGDLSTLPDGEDGKHDIRAWLKEAYPEKPATEIGRIARQMADFRWSIVSGDFVLASNGATVLGVGKVTGEYFYNPDIEFPHCLPVEWLSLHSWKQPDQTPDIEGKLTTVYRMKRPLNLIEAERQILNAKYGVLPSQSDDQVVHENGLRLTYSTSSNQSFEEIRSLVDAEGNGNEEISLKGWRDYVAHVLEEAEEPLRAVDITTRALALGMRTDGKTPDNTVAKVLVTNPDLFERVGRGLYALRGKQYTTQEVEFAIPREREMPQPEPLQVQEAVEHFDDEKLAPVLEPRLSRLIAELRRHVLVEEALVRRIYHALLNGHVILTGPPGTGKTELARLLPEILWWSETPVVEDQNGQMQPATRWLTETAYTTTLVTATSEWSTRTLISSIVPVVSKTGAGMTYRTQHGHLTSAILRNWVVPGSEMTQWASAKRRPVQQGEARYRGHWLIIDEFNRAPIDAALGEALTALGNGEALQVPIDGIPVRLPLPKDFRIIGTLNSFDRNYLNQISEALKRRFAFIEVLPPTRVYRQQEQGIVLYKALRDLMHLNPEAIKFEEDGTLTWANVVMIDTDAEGSYTSAWNGEHALYQVFAEIAWPLLEVLRVYRQLGTAQIISLVRQLLTPGILNGYTTFEQWLQALDIALCDVIADQLQVLLPDELDVLLWYVRLDADIFIERYNAFLMGLAGKPRRLNAHLEALSNIVEPEHGQLLTDEEVEALLGEEEPAIPAGILHVAFHLDHPAYKLPQFARRLRTYKAEHGL
ncbi:hypothetical protein KSD_47640 [Ktedonobacter sp. SOSP1-85]|uniref:AAA family ATPase n=1 Tax=Ktedonobacter sp. SOSP1-85 TaxID=2778367 RepID=UPI001915C59B|nr:AAA family ATPase [Ktedonobacter sp. SOSP1-85]GHO76993.1 hypothetical protein KSD_47640 [Ktedonobacter sp. SOSP1-85]